MEREEERKTNPSSPLLVRGDTDIGRSKEAIFHEYVLSFLQMFKIQKKKKKKKTQRRKSQAGRQRERGCQKYLLAHVSLLHRLIRHESKVNVREMGPLEPR